MGIYKIKISKSVLHFDRIKKIYGLEDYIYKNDHSNPLLIYGMFGYDDLLTVVNHKGFIYILWAGSDADITIPNSKKIMRKVKYCNNAKHISISSNLNERLNNFGFSNMLIRLNLSDSLLFIPSLNDSRPKLTIYIYNGRNTNKSIYKDKIYNRKNYEYIVKMLPQYSYIYSDTLNLTHNEMPSVYDECILGIRLCENDGCACTVNELGMMGLSAIHNGDLPNSMPYRDQNDIINKIKNHVEQITQMTKDEYIKNKHIVRNKVLQYYN